MTNTWNSKFDAVHTQTGEFTCVHGVAIWSTVFYSSARKRFATTKRANSVMKPPGSRRLYRLWNWRTRPLLTDDARKIG